MEIIDKIYELSTMQTKIQKRSYVIENEKDPEFVKLMKFILDKQIVTGLDKKKISKNILTTHDKTIDISLFEVIEYLMEHNTGRDEDIKYVQMFLKTKPTYHYKTLVKILTKKMVMGMTTKTWNEFVSEPNKIKIFSVMLAKSFKDNPKKVMEKEVIITQKLNGTRMCIIKENGKVNIWTRQGKPYHGCIDIEKAIRALPVDNVVFDGELLAIDKNNSMTSNERFTKTMSLSQNKNDIKTDLEFNAFDILPLNEFNDGKSKLGTDDRKDILSDLFDNANSKYLKYVKILYKGIFTTEIKEKFENMVIENKWEGVMLQLVDSKYECKRVSTLLKFKVMYSCDLRIVGFNEGNGKYEDTLGSVICEYKNNTINISGFSDELRNDIWNNQVEYINVIIEVNYAEETKNKQTGLCSLQFAQFKGFRYDKTEPSYD